jgi:hypothetical protein
MTERPSVLPPIKLEERAQMPEYRLYIMDRDRHVVGLAGVLTCASDQQALEQAECLRKGADDLEL